MTAPRTLLTCLVAGAMLVPASSASAAIDCASAPGTSAVDQYCETLPGPGGDKPTTGSPGDPRDAARAVLPARAAEQLDRPTATDAGILALVAGGPAKPRGRADGDGAAGRPTIADPGPSPSSDPLGAIPAALTDGPSLSPALPLIMLGIAGLIGGIAWTRSRSGRDA